MNEERTVWGNWTQAHTKNLTSEPRDHYINVKTKKGVSPVLVAKHLFPQATFLSFTFEMMPFGEGVQGVNGLVDPPTHTPFPPLFLATQNLTIPPPGTG